MKNLTTTLSLAIVFLAVIAASFSFVSDVPVKDVLIAQYEAIKGKGQESIVSDHKQDATPTPQANSFSVGKILGEEQGNINPTKAMVHRGKMYLLKQVDNRIGQLAPFKDRIEKITTLNESDRKSLVSELIAELDMFEALKAEISKSTTKADVKNVADKVKAEWIKSRRSVDRANALVLVSKENQLVSDADAAALGIQKRIDALKVAGKNTKPYEELLAAYNQKIASAKQDVASANEKFNAAASSATDDEKQKLIKGHDLLLSSSQENIREAYKLLKEGAQEDFSRRFK